ncbi:1,4-dihydroxy-6-naphthoate synthase [Phycisphaerales bacterium]|nr:1,4-dihydroxy-6-naphthoate synthase [Phycisphaerales bacterium]
MPELVSLTLAHSGDPDDAFMWWPITGKVNPAVTAHGPGFSAFSVSAHRAIATGRFLFIPIPGDIAEFNRLAAGVAPYDITALSVRAYADVSDRYVITACGSSFGEGYGPKVVTRVNSSVRCEGCLARPDVRIAVPGLRTSAFLTLGLMLGADVARRPGKYVELPFDRIIPAVVKGEVDAGLVIHEGQVMFGEAGLREVVDLGAWWQETRGVPLPLGINAVKRDLDARFGSGTVAAVSRLLRASLDHALTNRDESVEYTMPYARLNAKNAGLPEPSREIVEKYLDMYVTPLTVDMGEVGRRAISRLFEDGAAAGLCPRVERLDVV